ncbi:class I glutamine amidotransferase-like protein [Lentinula aciculospora]|uniref:Class I glutamine amidotransferase-like protein n=1 Tax=Lentinula aciculospora TaxID=153920 RepID=A0A9W9A4S2_9AGAR|nr:class I glutamine amidotransferase-like protein [Lentinula aciculospora]
MASTSTKCKLIALLVCDTPIPEVVAEHGEYPRMFHELMRKSLPDEFGWNFTMDAYDVVRKMEYPSKEKIDQYDAFMYTGSAVSAYADLEWIHTLVEFTAHLVKNHPKTRIFGICFGHQIVSLALGGTCVKNDGKWEIGPTKLRLTDIGESVFGIEKELTIQEMHQDHVPFIPKGFHLLASTDVSINQGMVSTFGTDYHYTPTVASRPSYAPSLSSVPSPKSILLSDIHIITVQGHPEFTCPIISKITTKRTKQGLITDALKEECDRRNDALGDKISGDGELIGRILWKILGVPL